ncbi:endonuclease [Dokdonia sp. Hel_I_53]|uniref:endonuclease n=1 Tax=Dokdonia sp. Hel_I_53 TaxID=1566287 RepID=UPI00119C73DE|nr:endonuclease [Dokdonia sp. Hel_I_53]TVZ51446.1 putative secreted protein (Por secretion system target) [Dokdonia sp. Hel_I_53]
MKKIIFLLLFLPLFSFGQQDYYDDTAVYLTGSDLLLELRATLSSYNQNYTYGDFRQTTLITDANPENASEVLLIYGYNDTDGDCTTDRTRANSEFGGSNCDFNREHTFPRSLANPSMGSANNSSTGIVADPHNLRPSDVQRNGNRGSKKFADGSGNSGDVGSGYWYPGDEWKGDVARIVMYMYTRYGEQCLPSLVGEGSLQENTEMLQLFLQWNVDDPVSQQEMQRNDPLENEYGSRNPFIDNPILATNIWGGPEAEDFWGELSTISFTKPTVTLYPNPADTYFQINTSNPLTDVIIYDITGKKIFSNRVEAAQNIDISFLSSGMYLVQIDKYVSKLLVK